MRKKLLFIGSVLCPCCVAVLAFLGSQVMPLFMGMEGDIPEPLLSFVKAILYIFILSIVASWITAFHDIVHAVCNPDLSVWAKIGWFLALSWLHIFVITVYWIFFLRDDPGEKRETENGTS